MRIDYTGYAILFFIFIVIPVIYWQFERTLNKNPSLPTDNSRVSPGRAIILSGLVVSLPAGLFIARDVQAYHKLNAIEQHGQRTEAIVDSFSWVNGRGAGSRNAVYHYSAPIGLGRTMQYAGEEYLGTDRPNDPHYIYANTTGRVPVAYDSRNPGNSALNFDDSVFTGEQAQRRVADAESLCWKALTTFVLLALLLIILQKLDLAKNTEREGPSNRRGLLN